MRFLDCFIVTMTVLFLYGTYIIFRTRSLKREFKDSGKKTFLEFFEQDFLGKKTPTWRWKYSFFYNSKMYFFVWHIMCICCYLAVILCAVTLILIYKYGYWQVLL